MPSLLGAADSFNSSSATIRPDNEQRQRRTQPGTNQLGPTDSIGRSFESLIEGRAGVLQQDTRFEQYLQPIDTDSPGPSSAGQGTFNPLDFLNDSAAEYPPQQAHTVQPAEFFRPSSAASHRSAASGASLSTTDIDSTGYYTTDMSDDGFAPQDLASPSPLNEIGALNLNSGGGAPTWAAYEAPSPIVPATISPSTDALGSSVPRAGPSRNIRGVQNSKDLEEKKRLDRLEHRRSINRRSAQKHRLRRKEEMETLQAQIRERDLEIRQLKEELAAVRAQAQTYMEIVKGLQGKGA
ncbi:hypothetical protein A1Q2_01939 [Trichosporon asahii var. asahii CBS 8904]|uniref:BZIP domain-containing protein n=1 Tax=Trichosporon asahii var. asahii (strain CBS 8904) TaxID=1220162 RepID=K1W4D2_TRIAC|nr:hypothetical protein A1Q2_01939 [Trichosporon asahii var. asahii CBS 8904]